MQQLSGPEVEETEPSINISGHFLMVEVERDSNYLIIDELCCPSSDYFFSELSY